MLLILANEEDSLAHAVYAVARRSGTEVYMCSQAEIAGRAEQDPSDTELLCSGRRLRTSDLQGVLFRLPACWWRTAAGSNDHDLIGAWYTLLWNLPCPVINRFGLSWWFDPAGHAVQLSLHLNASLMKALSPKPPSESAIVHMAGEWFTATAPESQWAAERLSDLRPQIARWQRETGVYLARLNIRGQRTTSVEPCPGFVSESAEIIGNVADAVFTTLTRTA
jgi:hypothetical protein